MAGVESSGWVSPSFQVLVDELADSAKEQFGDDFATSPDSVFGQFSNILAESYKNLYDLGEAITATQNRDSAEGVYLDYLANIIGLTRLSESGSSGQLLFVGDQGTTIAAFYPCSDDLSRNVLTNESLTLNRSLCYNSTFSVQEVNALEEYTIVVEGNSYTYTSGSGDVEEDILEGLSVAINTSSNFSSEVVDETLVVTLSSKNNTLTTTNSSNLTLESVGSLVESTAAITGELTFEAGSITKLGGSTVGLISVTNPSDFTLGREEETDEELRLRMSEREQSTGTATKPSIEASISEVTGVTEVLVIENTSMVTDSDGIPPKSYEIFIKGGDDDSLAEVIWETKPAAIPTYGNVTKIITDENGDEQSVSFSRKPEVYAWMRVTYTINSEETFPSSGEAAMKTSVVDFGNSFYNGEDYEPTKFYAPLYETSGVIISKIEIAITEEETDTPVYQETMIPVAATEDLVFDTSRITLNT